MEASSEELAQQTMADGECPVTDSAENDNKCKKTCGSPTLPPRISMSNDHGPDEEPSSENQEKRGQQEEKTLEAIKRFATDLISLNGQVGDISSEIENLQIYGDQRQSDSVLNGPTDLPTPTFTDTITQHENENNNIQYISYESELQMPSIMKLIQKDLSEPYSIYTYRYFIHNWPKLCFLAVDTNRENMVVGAIVCKLDVHKQSNRRGYIAMLAVDEAYRRKKIGSSLVLRSIRAMAIEDADEIVLETEITNKSALRLYENLGFVRDKRLFRYYLNGVDALRLKLWLK